MVLGSNEALFMKIYHFSKDGKKWEWGLSSPLTMLGTGLRLDESLYVKIDVVLFDFAISKQISKQEVYNSFTGFENPKFSKYIELSVHRKEVDFLNRIFELPAYSGVSDVKG